MKIEGSHFVKNYRTFESESFNFFPEKNKRVVVFLVKNKKTLLGRICYYYKNKKEKLKLEQMPVWKAKWFMSLRDIVNK